MFPATIANRGGIIRAGVLAGAAACALFALTLGPAAAAPSGADPTPIPKTAVAQRAKAGEERLERLYQREQNVLVRQQKVLDRSGDVIARAQARIDRLNSEGKDTSSLESGLDGFKAAIATAQGYHDAAKSALDAHAGFDASGTVTDRAQARDTLKTVGDAMRDFHRTMKKARADMRKAVREFVKDNRSTGSKPQ